MFAPGKTLSTLAVLDVAPVRTGRVAILESFHCERISNFNPSSCTLLLYRIPADLRERESLLHSMDSVSPCLPRVIVTFWAWSAQPGDDAAKDMQARDKALWEQNKK